MRYGDWVHDHLAAHELGQPFEPIGMAHPLRLSSVSKSRRDHRRRSEDQPRPLNIEQLECRRLLALNPTAAEQELLQLTNRFRTDPQGEFSRLMSSASPLRSRDPILQDDLDAAQVDGNLLRSELSALSSVPPVAWNEAIHDFANSHNAAMIGSNPPRQFHSNTLARRQALLDAGVNLRFAQGEKIHSENVFGFGKSPGHLFGGYVIDWGSGPGGMQGGRPHRSSIINADFEQAGSAISSFSGSGFGPLVNTHILANIEAPPVMVLGAVFEDKNDSGWYEAGEGIGSVQFVFEGPAGRFTTTGFATGGYQIELPPGTYTATASGNGLKFPLVMNNITVGATNVWKNFIYDPDVIPPDALESNNSIGSATRLTGNNQSLSSLSIHVPGDRDYFRIDSLGSGSAQFDLRFDNSAGNLDLRLLDSSGNVLATSGTTGNLETITANLTRDLTYYLLVLPNGGAVSGSYSLTVTLPQPARPVASPDRTLVDLLAPQVTIDILANDTDPDGDPAKLVPSLTPGSPPAFSINDQNKINYTAPPGTSGVQRATYTVTDDQNLQSLATQIEIFVIDFSGETPWQNQDNPADVNDDGITTPLDVLLVINEINARESRRLPTSRARTGGMFGFIDSTGDGSLSPLDVLLVINAINAAGRREGESEGTGHPQPSGVVDQALEQLMAASVYDELVDQRRRKLLARPLTA